jgi:hypothetical protein
LFPLAVPRPEREWTVEDEAETGLLVEIPDQFTDDE